MRRFGVFVALLTLVGGPAQAAGPVPGEHASRLRISASPVRPRAGEIVTFRWRVTDEDALTNVEASRIDYGDRRGTRSTGGRTLLCGEILTAAGLDHSFETFHAFRRPGRYVVRARVETRRSLCGWAISGPDRAEGKVVLTVLP